MAKTKIPINEKPPHERVKVGKKNEKRVINCLNKHHNWNLEEAPREEDRIEKVDCYEVSKTGKRLAAQVKTRVSGDDILVDIFEPYYGLDDDRTKKGRDTQRDYDLYICLSKDGKTIRVVNGKALKRMLKKLANKWKSEKCRLPFTFDNDCEFKWHRDRWSGVPKLLCFIPPEVFKINTEITFFDMK